MIKKIKPKHLYIHIPFCKSICTYCDFIRFIKPESEINNYINNLLIKLNKYKKHKFNTIYIGGGTPNSLSNKLLSKLLSKLYILLDHTYEFTIECNPELINENQVKIFNKYKINRVSLGVQTLNTNILKKYNRNHTSEDVINSIKLLNKYKINNINLDFIYGFNELTNKDIIDEFKLIIKYKIKHCSFYSLEVKDNSIISKQDYKLDETKIDNQLKLIEQQFKKLGYLHYEIANWSINDKYISKHNMAYWTSNDWIGLGYGAFGFENNKYYKNEGTLTHYAPKFEKYTPKKLYLHILLMGLRTIYGLDLNKPLNEAAYAYFKGIIDNSDEVYIKSRHLIARHPNKLNSFYLKLI